MHTFIINLPERTDRLMSAKAELAKAVIFDAHVFPAIDTRKGVVKEFIGKHFTKGSLGCMHSHLAVLKCCMMFDLFPALILEDDIKFVSDPVFSDDCDVLFVGWMEKGEYKYGTHALYFPTKEGAQKLAAEIEASEWTRQYDGQITALKDKLRIRYCEQSHFTQDLGFDTDIQHKGHHNALREWNLRRTSSTG